MKKTLTAIAVSVLLGAPAAVAQTPVDSLPQGNPIAGWAVEAIPVPQMQGRLNRQMSQPSIAEYAGQTGLVRQSVVPSIFASNRFERFAGDRQQFVFNGRAFFRVRQPQQYVFIASAVASSLRRQEVCELVMNVGGKTITSGAFRPISSRTYDVSPSRSTGPVLLSGNVSLQPGFYPIEFVVGCPRASEDVPIEVKFQVREERDAAPRDFANGEIFHIQR